MVIIAPREYKWNLRMRLNIGKVAFVFSNCFSTCKSVTSEDVSVTGTSQDAIETSQHSKFSIPSPRCAGYKINYTNYW
jgi:hypothetical protein